MASFLGFFFELASKHITTVFSREFSIFNRYDIEEILNVFVGVLLSEAHEHRLHVVAFDESGVISEGLESCDDNFIFVGGTASLFLAEHIDKLGEVDGGGAVSDHPVDLLVGEGHSDFVSGRSDVPSADNAILVAVHELEPFLELSYLPLRELVEDIGSTSLRGLLLLLLLLGGGGGRIRHACN